MKLRTIYKIVDDDEIQIRMQDLKQDDIFRIEPANETDAKYINRDQLYIALSDGYLNKDKIGSVLVLVEKYDKF